MKTLDTGLRSLLDKTIFQARDEAEKGASQALDRLGVESEKVPDYLNDYEKKLRRTLRAKMKQLGSMTVLIEECAYEHWHQMLFARYLEENSLLMHPTGVSVSLVECQELAPDEGALDGWELAGRYAAFMLPGIFRPEDPLLKVQLAPEHRQHLEKLLEGLPSAVFLAEDSLGWVYQFWQSKQKAQVNNSEVKIDRHTIAPVTQLFTEDYMVQFLLQNTLGAWWQARHPGVELPVGMEYLRYREDGSPAAGTFTGWPDSLEGLRILDPCCGSGHFLVAAFKLLVELYVCEGYEEKQAIDLVLGQNLYGLEIDQRCTQIAAFNLALAVWKRSGYRDLPALNIACSGLTVGTDEESWKALAGGDAILENELVRLYGLFLLAPELGSLINPRNNGEGLLFSADRYRELRPLLQKALAKEERLNDEQRMAGVTAQGLARAAEILSGEYNLIITNVPYRLRRKQGRIISEFCATEYPQAKNDLATVFMQRCLEFCLPGGSTALVTPQNWLFLTTYKEMRKDLLQRQQWNLVARLGEGGFQSPQAAGAFSALGVLTKNLPREKDDFYGMDVSIGRKPEEKDRLLKELELVVVNQFEQLMNPDSRISFGERQNDILLKVYANAYQGIVTGDYPRYGRFFWEAPAITNNWVRLQSTVKNSVSFGGREQIIYWEKGGSLLAENKQSRVQGMAGWGRLGIAVSQMRGLPCTLYSGNLFDINTAAIIPKDPAHLSAIWAFCSSPQFNQAVRRIDQAFKVTNATLVKVPFDLEYWQQVANEKGPLPEPYSNDPTQWLFKGQITDTTHPLQVAVTRLLGYSWPEQVDDGLADYIDKDGIVCLPAVAGEDSAAERLRQILMAAYGKEWSAQLLEALLLEVDYGNQTLDKWLRDGFFTQHCRLFQQRPFIWHIWDGRKDGFAALVNYHRLDYHLLERLTYTYLGDWLTRQRHAAENGEGGAEARYLAAQRLQEKLVAIAHGEKPYDVFVRWKPLEEQALGWTPDINDGVRMNIRPFVTAGILRTKPNIKWEKDKGKNPSGSPWGEERNNNLNLTLAEKIKAREEAGRK